MIDAEKATYDITFMCALLNVPRSSFYAWRNRAETPTAARRRRLAEQVSAEFTASRGTSGCRRITAALNRAGTPWPVGLLADLMRELAPGRGPATSLQAHHRARSGRRRGTGPAGPRLHRHAG